MYSLERIDHDAAKSSSTGSYVFTGSCIERLTQIERVMQRGCRSPLSLDLEGHASQRAMLCIKMGPV